MTLGLGWFQEKYKNKSLEELIKELENEKKLYNSGEILRAEENRIAKGIDDNSPLSDYETKVSVLEKLIKEKEQASNSDEKKAILKRYKIDENGNTYEEKEELKMPEFDPTFMYTEQLGKILNMKSVDIYFNNKRIEDINATHYWNPSHGEISLIVADDGSYLRAASGVTFDKHLEEFKNGKRNGDFSITKVKDTNQSIVENSIQTIRESGNVETKERDPFKPVMINKITVIHKPFRSAMYGPGESNEDDKSNIIIKDYNIEINSIIDLIKFKIKILEINNDSIKINIFDNKGILSKEKTVDYKNVESIVNIEKNQSLELYLDVYDAMEDWEIKY